MKDREQFCIVHETKESQILIDSDYDHDTEQFKITVKFWAANINGYASVSPSWAKKHESDYKRFFDKLKDINYAILFCKGVVDTDLTV